MLKFKEEYNAETESLTIYKYSSLAEFQNEPDQFEKTVSYYRMRLVHSTLMTSNFKHGKCESEPTYSRGGLFDITHKGETVQAFDTWNEAVGTPKGIKKGYKKMFGDNLIEIEILSTRKKEFKDINISLCDPQNFKVQNGNDKRSKGGLQEVNVPKRRR